MGAGGVLASGCWCQTLKGLDSHLRNYCPTRKLKQRKSKRKIYKENQLRRDRRESGQEARGGSETKTRTRKQGGKVRKIIEWREKLKQQPHQVGQDLGEKKARRTTKKGKNLKRKRF